MDAGNIGVLWSDTTGDVAIWLMNVAHFSLVLIGAGCPPPAGPSPRLATSDPAKHGLDTSAEEPCARIGFVRISAGGGAGDRWTFETAIVERYRRRESSVGTALIEMYLAGISVRRAEDITEALWGIRVSPSTVRASEEVKRQVEAQRTKLDPVRLLIEVRAVQ